MQQEVAQLIEEIDRVAGQTNFNGVKLLDGSFTAQSFQVGANVGETISVASIADSTKAGLGLNNSTATSAAGTAVAGALTAGALSINGHELGVVARDASLMVAAISDLAVNITATAGASSLDTGAFSVAGTTSGDTYTLTVGGVDIVGTDAGAGITGAIMDTALGSATSALTSAGVTVSGTFAGGNATFTKADGSTFTVAGVHSGAGTGGVASSGSAYGSIASIVSTGEDLVIAGAGAASAGLSAGTTTATGNTLTVATVDGANALITAIDTALNTVNGSRATLGAIQNRFESVVTSLQTSSESLSAARSRIQDTDFASETANLTKAQILQQAGMAMMAQANSLPQSVLSLLQ
jgi:flagellin